MSTSKYNSARSESPEKQVPESPFDFDSNDASKLRCFLKSLHISFKSQILENARILSELSETRKRNDHLEAELLLMEEVKSELDRSRHNEIELSMRCTSLEEELAKTKRIIKNRNDSERLPQVSSTDKSEAVKRDKCEASEKELSSTKNLNHVKDKTKPKTESIDSVFTNSISEKGSSSDSKPHESKFVRTKFTKEKNIGLMSQKQLRKKLSEITSKKATHTVKGKRGCQFKTSKNKDHRPIPNTSRKKCSNCGSSNHLTTDCRKSNKKTTKIPKSPVRNESACYSSQKPCFHCGNRWHTTYMCKDYQNVCYNVYKYPSKLNRKENSEKSMNNKYAYYNTDKTCSVESSSDRAGFVKKTSAVNISNLHTQRTQQVWVLKHSN
jgi:hypothetical protein